MILVHGVDAWVERRMLSTNWRGLDPVACGSWWELHRRLPDASCAVWGDPWIKRTGSVALLTRLRQDYPLHPLVVVTTREADNARVLHGLVVEDIVWLDEVATQLPLAVAGAQRFDLLRTLGRHLQTAEHIHPRLRTALSRACDDSLPLTSVGELAGLVGRDRRSVWRWWHESFPEDGIAGPKDFLDWLVLLRAVTLKTSGLSWTAVAARLGVHCDTLARIARRLTDQTLSQVEAGGVRGVMRPLLAAVMPLLRVPSSAPDSARAPDGDKLRRIERICGSLGLETELDSR